ncbi:alcohol oxidase [Mycena alexandri]|uniref:Alcohol oxidase n=1 Tax=Mycena alexandri TaxID=1745969 RepID=A0AAD6X3R7_9AGAR|nr:alcohol oxidase [Mycena alexandri]KAJ7033786.1 alcohol oxidase [Mycena alexandri]
MQNLLLSFILFGLSHATVITNETSALQTSYEFIVIGGGTTGLAVANRLSVNHTVLVVEQGADMMNSELINDPFTPFGTPGACQFRMETPPQIGSNGTRLRVQPQEYGVCLGGSSSINAMMGSRPTFAGMTALEALGNPGWGWNDFLPFMQKSETFAPPNAIQRADGADYFAAVHGFDGPVGVSFATPFVAPALQNAAVNTTQSVYGLSLSPDLGNGFSGGHVAHYYEHIHFNETLQADRRSSSAWSYLYPQSQQRKGLTVLTQHRVNSVLTTTARGNVTATGVLVEPATSGKILTFKATREIILSAGALNSPAILQRSGVGNATFLKGLGITPVVDLPGVGSNFQDQILLTNVSFPLAPSANNTNVTAGDKVLVGIVVGHPTARDAFGLNGTDIIRTSLLNSSAAFPLSVAGVVNSDSFVAQATVSANAYEIDHPLLEIFYNPGSQVLNVWSQSILPLSRGTLRINTTDPSVDPVPNPQYLSIEADIQVAIRMARGIAQAALTPPFSDLITPTALTDSGVPPPNATDAQVREWVLATYTPGIHFVGSNSMMPKEIGGVVSPELVVYGTTNLRVADASIMPLSVFPHCTLGLYGVGEKAADMILRAAG